jgi:hypothetical protein
LTETFDNLNRYKLKLNPTKCSFGVLAGQLLGFLVSARGIEAIPEKIQAILTMGKPAKLHDVQKLTGRVAALSRFVARLAKKSLPFYALMKKSDDKFEWTEEADAAFAQLKKVLSTPPVLVAPKEKRAVTNVYCSHTSSGKHSISSREKRRTKGARSPKVGIFTQRSTISNKAEIPYQNLAYSVFTTARKLRQYFEVHPIIVVNEAPLSNILNNPAATGRVSLWGIKLSPLDITYEKRKAIESQVLLDFTAAWLELQNTGPPDLSSVWTMYFDGSKRVQGVGAGVVLISPQGDKLKYVLRMSFLQASNNEAEYEALLHGMKMAKACGATRLKIFGDSNLVV